MHDVDRTQLETGLEVSEYSEIPELGSETYESGELGSILGGIFGEMAGEIPYETYETQELLEAPLPEIQETQMAAELLEITNEEELDHFLGSLIRKAAGAIGKVVKSPIGRALGGVLKQVAKRALPIAGTALGSFVGGPLGGAIGGKLASAAGGMFGLEVGGMSPEDRDFEVARRFVRFAGHAAKRAAVAPPQVNPVSAAKAAVVEAAKRYAPGLLTSAANVIQTAYPSYPAPGPAPTVPQPCASCGTVSPGGVDTAYRRKGFWYRRGRHIIVVGA